MAFGRLQTIRSLYRMLEVREFSSPFRSSRDCSNAIVSGKIAIRNIYVPTQTERFKDLKYWTVFSFANNGDSAVPWNHKIPEINCRSISSCLYKCNHGLPWTSRHTKALRSTMVTELYASMGDMRLLTTQAKAPPQARQMGSFKVSMSSPGIIYEPYAPREPVSFWRRWFTRSGWRRTKEDIILELRSAYAIAKLRKSGYSKQKFYKEALDLYKEINTQISAGDKTSLRKTVTEKMYSGLKNEIKQRESMWRKVHWELVEPVVKIRTLRARMIGVDRNDLKKAFIQLTLEFLTKQKFEAYDSEGAIVAGDKNKEVLVRDIWVFEKSLFHPGAYWRLCGRIKP